ncbi:MAG: hypothetical protein IPO52_14240 [Gemmatimonadetes bacterium]|nr:hypothetical protein [Gemmatimonadota bacterium]
MIFGRLHPSAAYRFWAAGCHTQSIDLATTQRLCAPAMAIGTPPRTTQYIQIAPRLVWAQLSDGEPHEPLDGWFALWWRRAPDGACFGVHPERPGLAGGRRARGCPGPVAREDGSRCLRRRCPVATRQDYVRSRP